MRRGPPAHGRQPRAPRSGFGRTGPPGCTAQAPAQPAEIWYKGGAGEGAGAVPRDGHGGAGLRRSPCAPLMTTPDPQSNLAIPLNHL